MSSAQSPKSPDGAKWRIDHVRMTVFLSEPFDIEKAEAWFEEVAGESPETTVRQRERVVEAIGRAPQNPELQMVLHCEAPLRIDWRLGPRTPVLNPSEEEQLNSTIALFERITAGWLAAAEISVKRLAFGALLLWPLRTVVEAHARISAMVPSLELPMDEFVGDVVYQINRSRLSTQVDGVRINRLNRWSVTTGQAMDLSLADGTLAIKDTVPTTMVRLQLDINTDARRTDAFTSDQLPSLWGELVALGNEISRDGDVP